MTTTDKAIKAFGFENSITITIAALEEFGRHELAEQLFEECKELAQPHWAQDDEDCEPNIDEYVIVPYDC